MSNNSDLVGAVTTAQTPTKQVENSGLPETDDEGLDFDDAASDEYWPDDDDFMNTEEVLDTTENTFMAEILAAEKLEKAMSVSFTQKDMGVVCAQLSQDESDGSTWATFKAMITELAEKDVDLVDWILKANNDYDFAAHALHLKATSAVELQSALAQHQHYQSLISPQGQPFHSAPQSILAEEIATTFASHLVS